MTKIATWNVNSLKVRLGHVLEWLAAEKPDVFALQETKTVDENFPSEEIEAAGYHAVFSGQKTYNGVAILSLAEGEEIANLREHRGSGSRGGVGDREALAHRTAHLAT